MSAIESSERPSRVVIRGREAATSSAGRSDHGRETKRKGGLFGKKAPKLEQLPNTPPNVFEKARSAHADLYGTASMEKQRWFLVAISALFIAMLCVAAVWRLTPLKQTVPYFVETDSNSGLVKKVVQVENVPPSEAVIRAEAAKWVEAVYTIDPRLTSTNFKWANARAADQAIAQFREYRSEERVYERIQEEKAFIRDAKVTAVDAGVDGTAFVYVTTTDRRGSNEPTEKDIRRFRVTLHYKLSPATVQEDLLSNPLGMFITYFSAREEKPL